jgi:dienelactone hydrolase
VSFLAELRRRQVFKVAAAYAVVGWLLIQVASIILPTYEAPQWVMQAFVTVVISGFPIALVLAWAFEISPEGVRRTLSTATAEPIASRSSIAGYLVIAILAGGAGAGSFWLLSRDVDNQWFHEEAIPAIEGHLTVGDWDAAYAIAEEAQARVADDPELAELWPRLSYRTDISSEPPGATVFRRAYDASESEWKELGRTPLEGIRIPFGLSRLKLELEGYLPLLRTVGGGSLSPRLGQLNTTGSLDVAVGPETYRLDTQESLPEGKVRVPAWTEIIDGAPVAFSDYFLDRTEVTNAQFKVFVDAGGYQRRELWEPVVHNGKVVPWEEAMTSLTDRTGRPGPSTWEAGDFPRAQGDFPVSGVSWYEAAAYARFMGQELPTAYHWRRARAGAEAPWTLAASNLSGDGPREVTASRAMSYVGAYDLAGNVREWTATASEDELIIAGASWNDQPYVAAQPLITTAPPLDRSPGNGFRLAIIEDEPGVRAYAAAPFNGVRGAQDKQPVGEETYAAYAAMFAYDSSPLNASIDAEQETRLWTRQRITFDAAYGDDRMVLYLYLPTAGSPPYQTVVYWPTGTAYLLNSLDDYPTDFDFILKGERALALPIYAGTFERRNDRGPPFAPAGPVAYRDNVIEGVNDLRRSIDYLETRSDIDSGAVAYFGHSQGGVNAPIALAQEPRLRAGVAYVGFLPVGEFEPSADPLHALPRVKVPVLLLSGEFDSTAPLDNARRYFDLIGTSEPDKRHVIAPGAHFVPRDVLIRETLDWLDMYLGPPRDALVSRAARGDKGRDVRRRAACLPTRYSGRSSGARFRRTDEELRAVCERDVAPVRALRPVLGLEALHGDLRARGQGVAVEPATQQRVRCAALDHPDRGLARGLVGDFQVDPRMRVDPLHLHDFAFELHGPVRVELRSEGVMRARGCGCDRHREGGECTQISISHGIGLLMRCRSDF